MHDRILVTGGAGFIGSNFILQWMRTRPARVVNLDKLTYAGNLQQSRQLADESALRVRARRHRGPPLVARLLAKHHPRAIVHFAAESHVDRSIHGPDDFVRTNIDGTFACWKKLRAYWTALAEPERKAFRFLHVSTDEVYGSLGPDDPPFSETTAVRAEQSVLRRQRPRPTIWFAPIITPTACRRSRPIARTITAHFSFRKS